MLLVRPRPAVGESPMSFLFRVAQANGYMSVSQLLGLMRRDGAEPLALLFEQLGLPMHAHHLLFGMAPGRWSFERHHLGLEASDFNWTRKRWCSGCLQERPGVFLGAWSQKLACCCLTHACWLSDLCAACGAVQHWSDPSLDRCRCGARLSEAVGHVALPAELTLVGALIGCTSWPSGRETCFAHLSMKELGKLVRLIGRFGGELRPKKVGKTPNLDDLVVSKELLTSASHLFSHWPTNFFALLQRTQEDRSRDPSLNRTFQPIYKVLYALLSGVEYQFMRDAFEDYLHEHWWGLVCGRNRRLKASTRDHHPRLSLAQAASSINARPTVIRRLVDAQQIDSATAVSPSGRSTTSVLFDEMAALQVDINSCLSLGAASRALQLSEARVRQLIACGVLPTLTGATCRKGQASWMIPRRGIESLLFECVAPDWNTLTIAVKDALRSWHMSAEEAALLVTELRRGRLETFGVPGQLTPIGGALLSVDEVLAWRVQINKQTGVWLSISETAVTMHLKQQVIYHLVACGLLSHRLGAFGERLIGRDSIRHFQCTYVSLATLAALRGTSPRALLSMLDARPVTGPSVDGSRQYFFRREDVGVVLLD
jgi:hypothetical protein